MPYPEQKFLLSNFTHLFYFDPLFTVRPSTWEVFVPSQLQESKALREPVPEFDLCCFSGERCPEFKSRDLQEVPKT